MARRARLLPKFDHGRQQWVLNVPPGLSDTGARQRVYFPRGAEQDAVAYADQLKQANENLKELAKHVRPELMRAAVKWEPVVIELGFRDLDHFCATKVAELEKASAAPTLASLLDAFQADHSKNWSSQYLGKRWKPFRSRLDEIEDLRISQMDQAFWRDWLKKWKETSKPGPTTYNQQLGGIRSIFELAAAKRVHPINPLDDLPGAKERKGEVPVSTPEEVQRLLDVAWKHDREMVPYFVTCYFAGLRPDSEAKRVHFEHFDWNEGHLKVGITKTDGNPNRYVQIEDTLKAWMRPWLKKKGSIIPDNFAKRRRRLIYGFYTTPNATFGDETKWKALVPWGHDITRHSYGSYWEAAHRGKPGCKETLAANMGHVDFKTFDRYYKNARSRAEGKAYWEIQPPEQKENVIAIA
ncbi:tyrosine-type recombinase/integrase [Luteolibacter luteus]|uniref:Site-specific integrase n=1 Tax=Luteolibacter luteus TaxID=2728835 RepID=A0A858RHG4_9BACT|nr:site-specific integrase [Luteolibacter luteus]QJE95948.1 site-specific integrase [Luteolibacter luteus]